MKLIDQLQERSNNKCELCKSTGGLKIYEVPPGFIVRTDKSILICDKCMKQLDKKEELDANHWKGLTEVMWSELPAIQVVAWRMLNRLRLNTVEPRFLKQHPLMANRSNRRLRNLKGQLCIRALNNDEEQKRE